MQTAHEFYFGTPPPSLQGRPLIPAPPSYSPTEDMTSPWHPSPGHHRGTRSGRRHQPKYNPFTLSSWTPPILQQQHIHEELERTNAEIRRLSEQFAAFMRSHSSSPPHFTFNATAPPFTPPSNKTTTDRRRRPRGHTTCLWYNALLQGCRKGDACKYPHVREACWNCNSPKHMTHMCPPEARTAMRCSWCGHTKHVAKACPDRLYDTWTKRARGKIGTVPECELYNTAEGCADADCTNLHLALPCQLCKNISHITSACEDAVPE